MGDLTRLHRSTNTNQTRIELAVFQQLTQPETSCRARQSRTKGDVAHKKKKTKLFVYLHTCGQNVLNSGILQPTANSANLSPGMGTIVKKRSTVRTYSTAPRGCQKSYHSPLAPHPWGPYRVWVPIKQNGASPKARPVNQLSNTRKNKSEFKKDESQWIEAQRPLSAPTIPRFDWIVCPGFPRPTMRTTLNTDPFNE